MRTKKIKFPIYRVVETCHVSREDGREFIIEVQASEFLADVEFINHRVEIFERAYGQPKKLVKTAKVDTSIRARQIEFGLHLIEKL